jgi:NADH pyrophosphatase NudC (nudix superfamily)
VTTERVHFRLLKTPCCGTLLCWVNPRFPNYCPECSARIFPEIRGCVIMNDDTATLKYTEKLT